LRTSGRWHTRGKRVVYCAQSPAVALLEILVHFEIEIRDLPARYRLLKIEVPDDVRIERVTFGELPGDWSERTDVTRAIGDTWLARGSTVLLSVPSAIVPETFNVLLNPAQQDARRIVIARTSEHAPDPRLLEQLTRGFPVAMKGSPWARCFPFG
jgi:RES domain-containing protein